MPAIGGYTDMDPDTDNVCRMPGWDVGPSRTGGEPEQFYCERTNGHTGFHAWGGYMREAQIAEWPVFVIGFGVEAVCLWCGESGHASGNCPHERCDECDQVGHVAGDCSNYDLPDEPFEDDDEDDDEDDCDCDDCDAAANYDPTTQPEDGPESTDA